jgi:hypothetical protein
MTKRKEHRNAWPSRKRVDRVASQRTIHFDITEQEILWIGVALERDAGQLAHRAMSAVTTE